MFWLLFSASMKIMQILLLSSTENRESTRGVSQVIALTFYSQQTNEISLTLHCTLLAADRLGHPELFKERFSNLCFSMNPHNWGTVHSLGWCLKRNRRPWHWLGRGWEIAGSIILTAFLKKQNVILFFFENMKQYLLEKSGIYITWS